MQKVVVQIDGYTKVVLTLIAVLLAGLLAKPYLPHNPVVARETQYVVIDNSYKNPIPVNIVSSIDIWSPLHIKIVP